jgi:hypothetical protein
MSLFHRLPNAERLALMAGIVAFIAALAGFVPGVYRDSHALIVQSNGQDLATLLFAIPTLAVALVASARGSRRGRLVELGALGYLLYTYTVYAFVSILGPATILQIGVVGLAAWSMVATIASPAELPEADVEVITSGHLPRRATGAFLLLIAAIFAMAWLGQIAGAVSSGVRPQQLIDAGWPTSPIYVLDLAFVLPMCATAGWRLLTRRPGALRIAVPLLVFSPLLSLGVLSIAACAAVDGQALDPAMATIFLLVAAAGGGLASLALSARSRVTLELGHIRPI